MGGKLKMGFMARGLLASLALLCVLWSGAWSPAQAADQYLDPAKAFVSTAAMADPLTLDVHYAIAPGYYMYQERFEVRVDDAQGKLMLYRASTLTPPDLQPTDEAQWTTAAQLPRGTVKYDPTFEKDMEVYHGGVTVRIPLRAGAAAPLQVSITGQGCADQGLCYPPMTQTLHLAAAAGGYQAQGPQVRDSVPAPADEIPAASSSSDAAAAPAGTASAQAMPGASAGAGSGWLDLGDVGMAAWLHQAPLWQILGLSLIFGVLLSLTPCVLPMIPILLAVVAGGHQAVAGRRLRGLGLAASYVLGMSLVYTILGVAAGLLGAGLAAWLQSPWVIGVFAVLLALFALAMLGVFTLQVPTGMQSALQTRLQRMPGGHAGGVFVMGMLSALIVGPCVAAPLAGVLLFISQTGDVVIGGSALFAMAWGEGLILLAVGAGSGALLPRSGAWMDTLKSAFGLLLLATAWWMARPLLGGGIYASGWVLLAFWAALLLWSAASGTVRHPRADAALAPAGGDGSAAHRAAAAATAVTAPLPLLLRALALLLALWGLAQGAGLLAGGRDMLRPLAPFTVAVRGVDGVAVPGVSAATAAGVSDPAAIRARFTRVTSLADLRARLAVSDRPVMLDFYADWCVSCLEMERFTFSDPAVARRMDQMLLLQADVTRMTADDKAMLNQFNLFGPPGILFFDARGSLLPRARVVGFMKADAFGRVQDGVLAQKRPGLVLVR